jgi:hypothetical protein
MGGAAPGPRTRETADEAEVTLRERVAAEAEAGEIRAHALSYRTRGEGVRKSARLSEEGKGVKKR